MYLFKKFREGGRLTALFTLMVTAEFLFIPRLYFAVYDISMNWNFDLATLAISLPRLITALVLVFVLGPYKNPKWIAYFMIVYLALLAVIFSLSEVWFSRDFYGISRAFTPYVVGFIGVSAAFLLGLRQAAKHNVTGGQVSR